MEHLTIEVLLALGVLFILFLLGVVFLIPAEKRDKKSKKKQHEELVHRKKELEEKVARLNKHTRTMRDRILKYQKNEKEHEKVMMVEHVKVKKLQEKLSQEREWHKKEQGAVDKNEKELRQLKADLTKAQESFSKEHTLNIRLEREIKEFKQQNDALVERCRAADNERDQAKAKGEADRKEIAQLKKEVARLTEETDDKQWVAKMEYDRVVKLLEQKQKELQRMERERNRQR